jgi:transposase
VAVNKREDPCQAEEGKQQITIQEWRPREPAHVKKVRLARRAGRDERSQQVVQLREQGMKAKEIAKLLDLSQRTIQRFLAAGTFPEAKKRRKRQSCFDDFAPYVLKRWQDGERNGMTLRREIMEQGYSGSERTVSRYLETLKRAEVKTSANLHRMQKFSATTAVWLFVRDPKTLDEIEREDLAAFCQASTTLKRTSDLVQDFLLLERRARRTSVRRLAHANRQE